MIDVVKIVICHYVIFKILILINKNKSKVPWMEPCFCFIMHRARRCLLYSRLDVLALYMRCAIGLKNCILRKSGQEP